MVYADFTYYKDTYKGAMPEADFNRLSRQASAYLDGATFGNIKDKWLEDERVKDACCAVVDALYRQEQGGEVASESTGSWSRSYITSGKTAEQNIASIARSYLGNTGLLYGGVYS